MTLDRRNFLKMLGAGCSLFLSRSSIGAPDVGANGPCECVNIVLHGFHFMEFQGNNLLVASPPVVGHQYYYQDDSKTLQKFSGPIDLTGFLKSGTTTECPETILQFSRKDIKLPRTHFINNSKPNSYASLLQLPWPEEIIALRLGPVTDLNPGNVADSIERWSASKVATVICLKYLTRSSAPFTTRNYFAEHCHQPTVAEVNAALDSARSVFGKEFDLTMSGVPKFVPLDNPGNLPDGITLEDEKSLQEMMVSPCGRIPGTVEVATCAPFCVRQDHDK